MPTVDFLLPYLPAERILAAYRSAAGRELERGRLSSRESSAALVANVFGFFIDRPGELPLPSLGIKSADVPEAVRLERELRFPWSGGRHPWLDVVVSGPSTLLGIESKRYEPFRSHKRNGFSRTFWREQWGDGMEPWKYLRDSLDSGKGEFKRIDAVQLTKHALGIVTQARKAKKQAHLVYIYAAPVKWSDGTEVDPDALAEHENEVRRFSALVRESAVAFSASSYAHFLGDAYGRGSAGLLKHIRTLQRTYAGTGL